MTQLSFFKFSAFGLLLLNLGMIGFFLLTKPKHRPHPPKSKGGFKKEAIDILKLNHDQISHFDQSAKSYNEKIRIVSEQQGQELKQYFSQSHESYSDSTAKDLIIRLMSHEEGKMRATFKHFDEIKSMLEPQQHADFQIFMNEVLKFILFPNRKIKAEPKEM